MSKDNDLYFLTPMFLLGEQRYADLEAMARRIAVARYGKKFKGVPVLIFDGKGGSFDVALAENKP